MRVSLLLNCLGLIVIAAQSQTHFASTNAQIATRSHKVEAQIVSNSRHYRSDSQVELDDSVEFETTQRNRQSTSFDDEAVEIDSLDSEQAINDGIEPQAPPQTHAQIPIQFEPRQTSPARERHSQHHSQHSLDRHSPHRAGNTSPHRSLTQHASSSSTRSGLLVKHRYAQAIAQQYAAAAVDATTSSHATQTANAAQYQPPGLTSFLFPTGTETGAQRRALLDAWDHKAALRTVFPDLQLFDTTKASHTVSSFENARKERIYTHCYTPAGDAPPLASILILHGYADHSSFLSLVVVDYFVIQLRCRVYLMDHAGHGRSDGLHVFVPKFDDLVEDALQYTRQIRNQMSQEDAANGASKQKLFLFAESMGGALAFYCGTRHSELYSGAILSAPMCKISDHLMRVPQLFLAPVSYIANQLIPTLACTPVPHMPNPCFRRDTVHRLSSLSPIAFRRMPRVGTAVELVRVTRDIGSRLHEWTLPLLVLHGEADLITDPKSSQALYKAARTQDKTIKLYPGAWHSLLLGEPEDVTAKIRRDIAIWIHAHVDHSKLTSHQPQSPKQSQ